MTTEKETKETREENKPAAETLIAVVLDKSGSMESLRKDTIGGYNAFLSDQKDLDVPASFTLVQFSTDYVVVHDGESISKIPNLTTKSYCPDGGTSLLDAIGKTIISVGRSVKEREEDKPKKVIFVIITDGEENTSREFSRDNIFKMIQSKQDDEGWDFVFIGANQDAIQEASGMGIRASNVLDYAANGGGTQAMYQAVSRNMTSYRKCAEAGAAGAEEKLDFFSAEDKEEQKDLMGK